MGKEGERRRYKDGGGGGGGGRECVVGLRIRWDVYLYLLYMCEFL